MVIVAGITSSLFNIWYNYTSTSYEFADPPPPHSRMAPLGAPRPMLRADAMAERADFMAAVIIDPLWDAGMHRVMSNFLAVLPPHVNIFWFNGKAVRSGPWNATANAELPPEADYLYNQECRCCQNRKSGNTSECPPVRRIAMSYTEVQALTARQAVKYNQSQGRQGCNCSLESVRLTHDSQYAAKLLALRIVGSSWRSRPEQVRAVLLY